MLPHLSYIASGRLAESKDENFCQEGQHTYNFNDPAQRNADLSFLVMSKER